MTPRPHEAPSLPGPAAALAGRLRDLVPVIETERTRLRAPELSDLPDWFGIMCGPRAAHMGGPFDRDDAFADFATSVSLWLLRGHGLWTVEAREDKATLGFVLLGFEPGDREPELGGMVLPEAEGRGLAVEAARAALAHARDALRLPSLVSYADPDNARALRACERLGARRDAVAEAGYAGTPDEGIAVLRHWGPS